MRFSSILVVLLFPTLSHALTTRTIISTSQNPAVFSESMHLQAVVISADGTPPTGEVAFFALVEGAATETLLGSATLTDNVATFVQPGFVVGTHRVIARYAANGALEASEAALDQRVDRARASIALTSDTTSFVFGEDAEIAIVVSPTPAGLIGPEGEVILYDDGTEIGRATLALGASTFSLGALDIGAHLLRAEYPGNENFAGDSAALALEVIADPSLTTAEQCSASAPGAAVLPLVLLYFVRRQRARLDSPTKVR